MKKMIVLAIIIVGVFCVSPANADETANMNVSATLPSLATLSVTDLDFGELNPTSPTDGTATISVNTSIGSVYNISLSPGIYFDNQNVIRGMRHTSMSEDYVDYSLYQDASLTTLWGESVYLVIGNPAGPFIGDGLNQDYTVYGRANPNSVDLSSLPSGAYTDTVTVTVEL